MNVAALSKEQKQKLILAVAVIAAVVYGLYRFVLIPTLSTMKESRNNLSELRSNLEKADIAIRNQKKVQEQLQSSADELYEIKDQYIPSIGNPLTWATEVIYAQGRKLGIDIESVSPIAGGSVPWAKDKTSDRVFVPYMVRIIATCSFFDLVDLINSIELDNPFACVKSIIINKGDGKETGDYNRQRII